jgi:monoamine oxidase
MAKSSDVIVIGAGAAGLAAAAELGRSGLSVVILEARDRIGGRILTQRDPVLGVPIEYGAEFIHGFPPEIWATLQSRKVSITEAEGEPWCFRNNELSVCNFFPQVDAILQRMSSDAPDESFLSFLNRCFPLSGAGAELREARDRALAYIVGFNAADPEKVGVHWLVEEMRAEEQIQGDRGFRSANGYEDLLDAFREELAQTRVSTQTDTVVNCVAWKPGQVEVKSRRPTETYTLSAARVLITLPLGVLQASVKSGVVQFMPSLPGEKVEAMKKLEMGKVMRITLRFRHRFWDTISPRGNSQTLSKMSFLFSDDESYPTWWTSFPRKSPIITGWAPHTSADRLSGKSRAFVIDQSLRSLSRLLKVEAHELESWLDAAYFHDWQSDPFSLGAYSYGTVGSAGSQKTLAEPVENTLFFAGEATETTGHNGTVHGAIASGRRAAKEILRGCR